MKVSAHTMDMWKCQGSYFCTVSLQMLSRDLKIHSRGVGSTRARILALLIISLAVLGKCLPISESQVPCLQNGLLEV